MFDQAFCVVADWAFCDTSSDADELELDALLPLLPPPVKLPSADEVAPPLLVWLPVVDAVLPEVAAPDVIVALLVAVFDPVPLLVALPPLLPAAVWPSEPPLPLTSPPEAVAPACCWLSLALSTDELALLLPVSDFDVWSVVTCAVWFAVVDASERLSLTELAAAPVARPSGRAAAAARTAAALPFLIWRFVTWILLSSEADIRCRPPHPNRAAR